MATASLITLALLFATGKGALTSDQKAPYYGPVESGECGTWKQDPCVLELNQIEITGMLQGDNSGMPITTYTRAYGTRDRYGDFVGSIPGPTFRFKSGETKYIKLVNNLSPVNNVPPTPENQNVGYLPNTTNIHTVMSTHPVAPKVPK